MPVDLSTLPKDEKSGLPSVPPPSGKHNVAIPESVAKMTFEDFETEQLPEQGIDTTKVEDKKNPPQAVPETVDKETPEQVEEVPKEEETKEEPTVEQPKDPLEGILKRPGAKPSTEGAKPATDKPIVPPKKEAVRRDYTGYGEEDVAAFKKMSDEAYSYTTKRLAELKALKENNYLQHERAYTLSPEFQEIQTTARLATFEERYWKEQLIKMDAGQDCIPLQGYDTKTGQPVYGNPIKATKALEEEVRQALYSASQTKNSVSQKLQEFPQKYKNTLSTDLNFLENYRKQQFGWVTDPTMMDATIDIGGQEKSLKQITQDVENMIPPYMRSHPLVNLVKDLVISVRIHKAQIDKYASTSQVAKTKAEEADLVEPSSKAKVIPKGKGQAVHGMTEFRVDPEFA